MKYKILAQKIGIDFRIATTNIVLVASAFVWYFLAFNVLQDLLDLSKATDFDTLTVIGVNVGGIAVAAIIGAFLVEKYKKRIPLLYFWMFAGILISLIPIVFTPSTNAELIVVSIIFGGYFGLGMPATMGYFSASTEHQNRARLGGFTFLVIALAFFLLGSLSVGNTIIAGVVLAAVRIAGLLLFYLLKKNEGVAQESGRMTYFRIVSNRSFLLFLIPWIVFNLVNYLTIPFTTRLAEGAAFDRSASLYENILIAAFAVITGFLADSSGRKRLAILGFAMLGVGYAALGLFQGSFGWYIYIVADGIAWGVFNVLFLFTLWGDLAQGYYSEKMYVIGSLPYLFSNFMRLLLAPFMSSVEPTTLFSFASFFLFVAVLPLFYAPETLPEKTMKDRDLKSYTAKALKHVQKEAEKSKGKIPGKAEKENKKDQEEHQESPDDEEARKLAEKYY
jgi:MFS family permease